MPSLMSYRIWLVVNALWALLNFAISGAPLSTRSFCRLESAHPCLLAVAFVAPFACLALTSVLRFLVARLIAHIVNVYAIALFAYDIFGAVSHSSEFTVLALITGLPGVAAPILNLYCLHALRRKA